MSASRSRRQVEVSARCAEIRSDQQHPASRHRKFRQAQSAQNKLLSPRDRLRKTTSDASVRARPHRSPNRELRRKSPAQGCALRERWKISGAKLRFGSKQHRKSPGVRTRSLASHTRPHQPCAEGRRACERSKHRRSRLVLHGTEHSATIQAKPTRANQLIDVSSSAQHRTVQPPKVTE